jgi:hypothetical protein
MEQTDKGGACFGGEIKKISENHNKKQMERPVRSI